MIKSIDNIEKPANNSISKIKMQPNSNCLKPKGIIFALLRVVPLSII